MKRFSSRYEKIRRLRAQQEDACRAAAAARNTERADAERSVNLAETWVQSVEVQSALSMNLGVTGAVLNSMASQIEKARQDLKAAQANLQKAEEALRQALETHKQARAELRIVEEMIHREHAEHRREQLRVEEHQLQEQAAQSYYRNLELSPELES
jgi:flagellar export protein FliJ